MFQILRRTKNNFLLTLPRDLCQEVVAAAGLLLLLLLYFLLRCFHFFLCFFVCMSVPIIVFTMYQLPCRLLLSTLVLIGSEDDDGVYHGYRHGCAFRISHTIQRYCYLIIISTHTLNDIISTIAHTFTASLLPIHAHLYSQPTQPHHALSTHTLSSYLYVGLANGDDSLLHFERPQEKLFLCKMLVHAADLR